MKEFLGKVVGKITTQVYQVIRTEADRLHLYTWELRIDSKADKIFGWESFDFAKEETLTKELLVFFVNSMATAGHIGFMKQLKPLEFDSGMDAQYIQCFSSDQKKLNVLGELDALYEDAEDKEQRRQAIEALGSDSVFFDADEIEAEVPEEE